MDEIDNEIDSSIFYKQIESNLTNLTNLNDSLNRFGYKKDDRIERRDTVYIYNTIKNEIENEINDLTSNNNYKTAKEMRNQLNYLKNEFCQLQITNAKLIRDDQNDNFIKGKRQHINDIKRRHINEEQNILNYCNELRNDLNKTHEIERENLELKINQIKKLPTVYSKRLIELLKSESSLIRLNEYEEARKVRNMIDKILPNEEANHDYEFHQRNEMKREALHEAHREDIARLEEKIKGIIWNDKRRRDAEYSREIQRVKNHLKDMNHTHLLESRLKPELSVKPSALWTKRPGYQSTSASMRGTQFLNTVRGYKGVGNEVFADSLVDKHDFSNTLPDTKTIR